MSQSIATLALVVRDYDEAIAWFSRCLGFDLVEDVDMGGDKRWVRMRPPGGRGAALLLAKAVGAQQEAAVGNQAGGRVFLFLETDDFERDHGRMTREGVRFWKRRAKRPTRRSRCSKIYTVIAGTSCKPPAARHRRKRRKAQAHVSCPGMVQGKAHMRLTRRGLLATSAAAGFSACATQAKTAPKTASSESDATELAAMIGRGDLTAAEAVEAAIKRAEAIQPQLNFMVTDMFAMAREQAKAPLAGPFAGVPFLVKDHIDLVGVKTRLGSRSTELAPKATKQDVRIDRTLATGVVPIGKSALPEFAYLPTTEPLAFGATRNPWNPGHSTGGSSGGSAAAVAAGVVPIAHATDGGGSIRIPAANCGLVGLKPSRGRMIDNNVQPGPLVFGARGCVSRTVRDTARFLAATETTGAGAMLAPVGLVSAPGKKRLKAGLLTKGFIGMEAEAEVVAIVHAAARLMEGLGHSIEETSWPVGAGFPDDFLATLSLGAVADVKLAFDLTGKPVDETSAEPFTLRLVQNAAAMRAEDVDALQKRLIAAANAYDTWIDAYDVVMSPVLRQAAPPLGFLRGDVPFDTLRERLIQHVGYTPIHNVAGAPAISLPLGWTTGGLPVGAQISAAKGQERVLLELAFELEAAQPWISKRPGIWAG